MIPRGSEIPEPECNQMRSQYASGTGVDNIADEFDHTWKTVVRHLSGACSHEENELVVSRHEILQRHPITAEACISLRRAFHEDETSDLLSLSKTVPWSYQTVLTHVNGECSHDIELQSREIEERSHITTEQCQQFREVYRRNTNLTLSNLSSLEDEFDIPEGSIRRHIRFRCSHDPKSSLLEDIDDWKSVVDDIEQNIETSAGASEVESDIGSTDTTIDYTDIATQSGIPSPDPSEVVADIGIPDPERVETTTSRVVRNTALSKELKEDYQYHCQLCGEARHKSPLEHYAEAHHIKPLGRPHEGPDVKENILVLCPNHHADFDHGLVHVDPETHEVIHATDKSISGEKLQTKEHHDINSELLKYHNTEISKL